MPLAVHLSHPPDASHLTLLRERLHHSLRLTLGPDLPAPPDYEVLVAGRPRREELTSSPRLHSLVIPWAGLPTQTRELLLGFPHVAVYNLHHNAGPVAEMAVTLMLAAAKGIIPVDRTFRSHDWTPRYRPAPAIRLEGKTALILGYGAIGRRVARACRGLGMKVVAIRRRPSASATGPTVEVHPPQDLRQLLPTAHALLICLPHTPDTDGLIGRDELALLPVDAVLVNVGRGPIVDEGALYHALQAGTIHAAGLDVWYNYPPDRERRVDTPPSVYPFHELDNVVMSPHRGGSTDETEALRMEHLAALLNRLAKGERPASQVDLQAGY
jgi:phosphoglycerate dehydrogenase-like enzyme